MHVLVVDDWADTADSLATLLRLWGYEVCTALNGPQALEVVARYQPQVVLIDLGLPGMDGYQLARRLPGLQCIAMTGHQGDGLKQRSLEAGFRAHLFKPFEPDELEGILKEIAQQQTMPSAQRVTEHRRRQSAELLGLACRRFWSAPPSGYIPVTVACELRRRATALCSNAARLKGEARKHLQQTEELLAGR